MGIKGLWKEVQPACRTGHISQLRGMRVGVDAYCWLHRAAIASSIALSTGQQCDKFIQFFMARVDLVLGCGISMVVVFDGTSIPMKHATEEMRGQRRHTATQEGLALLAQGRRDEAFRAFERGLEITPEVAFAVIQVLRERNIECIVAPYEADAQLGYLAKEGYIQAVISEDSDLIVYNTALLVAKLDGYGNCDMLRIRDLPQIPSLSGLTYELFMTACILAGCDYLQSLPGIGIKTALKAVAAARSMPAVISSLASQGFAPRELALYEESLHRAFYCFAHHIVYDPGSKTVTHFTPLPAGVDFREDIVGELWDAATALKICEECALDPATKRPYEGTLQPSVAKYWERVRKGQRTLSEVGVEVTRIVKSRKPQLSSNDPSDNRSLESPLSRRVVVSKYFAHNSASQNLSTDENAPTGLPHTGASQNGKEGHAEGTKLDHNSIDVDIRVPLDESQHSTNGTASPSSDSQLPVCLRDRNCPHGYMQCNKVHSIFYRCYEGKGWKRHSRSRSAGADRIAPQTKTLKTEDERKTGGPQSQHQQHPQPQRSIQELEVLRFVAARSDGTSQGQLSLGLSRTKRPRTQLHPSSTANKKNAIEVHGHSACQSAVAEDPVTVTQGN